MARANFNLEYGSVRTVYVRAGTFVYSGFGMGWLHIWSGQTIWTNVARARRICDEADLKFRSCDGFKHAPEDAVIYSASSIMPSGPEVFTRSERVKRRTRIKHSHRQEA